MNAIQAGKLDPVGHPTEEDRMFPSYALEQSDAETEAVQASMLVYALAPELPESSSEHG